MLLLLVHTIIILTMQAQLQATDKQYTYLCDAYSGFCTEDKTGFHHCAHNRNRGGRLEMHIHCKPQRAHLQWLTQHHLHKFGKYGLSHDSEVLAVAAATTTATAPKAPSAAQNATKQNTQHVSATSLLGSIQRVFSDLGFFTTMHQSIHPSNLPFSPSLP